jgi:hypothetical protein
MSFSRRTALCAVFAPVAYQLPQEPPDPRRPFPDHDPSDDSKLPNGKSQKDAISKQAHEEALKEADSLVRLAEDLRDELKRAGNFVVSVSSLRKTEEIEKLARHIRGKLKA